jgi:hypothetical protein
MTAARRPHPDPRMEAIVKKAESGGWTVSLTTWGKRWASLTCPAVAGCSVAIHRSPSNPARHRAIVLDAVQTCPH